MNKMLFLYTFLIWIFSSAVTTHDEDTMFRKIGHRGGVVDTSYAENSLPALEAAYKRGYCMVEIDVRLTNDGQLIAQHDPGFTRYYHVNKRVQELTWDTIQRFMSDKGNSRPLLFEEVLQYCQGRLQIMVDNKITGNDTVSFRRIEDLLRQYHLLDSALIIGTSETRNWFTGKAKTGYNAVALKEKMQQPGFNADDYFLFDHGNTLTREDVSWANGIYLLVVPSVNKFHYRDVPFMQGAERDIQRLKQWGVRYFQIDSEFDRWLE